MKNKRFSLTIWNKKGQVFLLLALVVLLYLILLSSTVYRITQIPYIDPAPNQEQTMNYIDNSISALYDLADASLSQYSQGIEESALITDFGIGIATIEDFLENHNFVAYLSFDESSFTITNSSMTDNPAYAIFGCEVSISVQSPEITYDSTIYVSIAYYMEFSDIDGTENYITIYKIEKGIQTPISDCEITTSPSTTIVNLRDGRYQLDLQAGLIIAAQFSNQMILWKEI